jgi:Lon-like protease
MYADRRTNRPSGRSGGRPLDKRNKSAAGSAVRWAIAAAAFMIFFLYIPAPFLVYQPGLTESAEALVEAEPDRQLPEGEWLITTVFMARSTNYWTALQGLWRSDREVHSKKAVLKGSSTAEYALRMNVLMEGSQSHAIEAAYRAAGIPYEQMPSGLLVARSGDGSEFQAGDRIMTIGGEPVKGAEDAARLFAQRAGVTVPVEVLRGGGRKTFAISITSDISADIAPGHLPRLLGGVELTETRTIRPADPDNHVTIDAGEVGGPSAGLLFGLYIYDLLTDGELGGGKRIAATGTITPIGDVGAVGGIAMKVIAADRAGADMFIVPAGNDKEARAKAEELGTDMRIAAVSTLQEAIDILAAADAGDVNG